MYKHLSVCKQMSSGLIKNVYKLRGAYDKFPDVFRMGTFIDSTHMKL